MEPLREGVTLVAKPDTTADLVHLTYRMDLDRHMVAVLKALGLEAALWLSYAKQASKVGTELNRDILWRLVEPYGLAGVAQLAVDDVW